MAGVDIVPVEVYSKEDFLKIVERALEIRVKKDEKKGIAKVKARTKKYLYTIKINLNELDDFLKSIQELKKNINIVYL